MADGDISDASPPRRRHRSDIQKFSSLNDSPSQAADRRPETLHRQSSHSRDSSPPRRHRDIASNSAVRRTHQEAFAVKGLERQKSEDLSDASPPRRRTRRDRSNSTNATKTKTSDATNSAGRIHRPEERRIPNENESVRSSVPPGRRQRVDSSQTRNQTIRNVRSVNNARAPRNRFGIRPGPRWDGVNRTNGFEERLEAMHSMRKDVEIAGYRASVADL